MEPATLFINKKEGRLSEIIQAGDEIDFTPAVSGVSAKACLGDIEGAADAVGLNAFPGTAAFSASGTFPGATALLTSGTRSAAAIFSSGVLAAATGLSASKVLVSAALTECRACSSRS